MTPPLAPTPHRRVRITRSPRSLARQVSLDGKSNACRQHHGCPLNRTETSACSRWAPYGREKNVPPAAAKDIRLVRTVKFASGQADQINSSTPRGTRRRDVKTL